ncbi:universal stress protein [Candidatus Parabeggiatoa sp. HSG14]|uniref:universal stress protein n=1 Tax=Candidatus Parabeggiatoa sp. HSG14 TaxID=3055593 RepID=UPI0025A84CCF|nr:universal stress protein [Thiotrichales bacterium HSG14]
MTTQTSPLRQLDKILLATDGSKFSAAAEQEAISLSRLLDSHLYIMSVVHGFPEDDTLNLQYLIEQEEEKAHRYMDAIKSKAVGIKCENILRNGEVPYQEIVDTAEEQQVELIVMGRRGKKNMLRFLIGASTTKVIDNAHCSVLVTPRDSKIEGKNILLAVDASLYNDRITITAINLAKRLKAPITLISIVYDEHDEKHRQDAEKMLERTKKLMEAECLSVKNQTVTDKYAENIAKTAQNIGCDLILIDSYGLTGLKKLLLGNISEQVISLAQCAVLVVKDRLSI